MEAADKAQKEREKKQEEDGKATRDQTKLLDDAREADRRRGKEAADVRVATAKATQAAAKKDAEEQHDDAVTQAKKFFAGSKPMTGSMPGPGFLNMIPPEDRTPQMRAGIARGQVGQGLKSREQMLEAKIQQLEAALTANSRQEQNLQFNPMYQQNRALESQVRMGLLQSQRMLHDEQTTLRQELRDVHAARASFRSSSTSGSP
jgi:hypothetical protein